MGVLKSDLELLQELCTQKGATLEHMGKGVHGEDMFLIRFHSVNLVLPLHRAFMQVWRFNNPAARHA